MPKPRLIRTRSTHGLRPGPLFMGLAGFMVVGMGMVAALNLSQMSSDTASQAFGPKACAAVGGVVEKVNGKRTGYCMCPSGIRVLPSQHCAMPPTPPINPVLPGGKPDASPSYDGGGAYMSPSPMYDDGGKTMDGRGVTRPYQPVQNTDR